jgi:hypothetical protein
MLKFGSRDTDRELREILAYLREPNPSRRVTAERLSRLAFLVWAMSVPEALQTLGLPPNPSETDIAQAYKAKAFENHPDRGGDPSKMVEINVAKDTLLHNDAKPVGTSDEDAEGDSEDKAVEILDKEFKPLGKKPHRWIPPNNFALNRALFGWNAWYFTVLPMRLFGKKTGYRPASDRLPEGLVLHPIWSPFRDAEWREMHPQLAEKLIRVCKQQPSIKDAVSKELRTVEDDFKVEIPSSLKSKILADCEKVAKRRIDVDRLRVRDELWPFDGGKPIKLGSWD